jgi:hypothetical protein
MSFLISAAVGSMSLFGYSVYSFYGGNEDNEDNEKITYELITDDDLTKECSSCKKVKNKSDFSNRQFKKNFKPRCKDCIL